jgi:AraC-like DNA-binding protein
LQYRPKSLQYEPSLKLPPTKRTMARSKNLHAPSQLQFDRSTIRAFFFWPLVKELSASGVDTTALLREHGILNLDMVNPYAAVPLANFVGFAEKAAHILKRPFLGLEIGGNFVLADLGPFYSLFTLAADLQSAIATLARYQWVWQTNTSLELNRGNETSVCTYSIADSAIWPRRQDAEFSLSSICAIIRHLTHQHWAPVHVQFEHSTANRAQRLKRFFRAPVSGNGSCNSITIRNADLDRPLSVGAGRRDAALLPILERHLLDLVTWEAKSALTIPQLAALHIEETLGRGLPCIESTASQLRMSTRTLRRRLGQAGTSFRQLLEQQRRLKVESVLKHGPVPLSTLAGWLSYSDAAVLSRAFKIWTGMSPARFSKQAK